MGSCPDTDIDPIFFLFSGNIIYYYKEKLDASHSWRLKN